MSSKKSKNSQQEGQGLDNLNHALSKTEKFIEQNRYWLFGGVGAIILVVVGVLLYKSYVVAPRNERAQQQLFYAQQQFEKDSLDLALNGDGNSLGFLQVIENYSSTKAGNLANYYAGLIYREKGEWDLALKHLKAFKKRDEMLSPLAYGAQGDCFVEKGDFSSAMSSYNKAIAYKKNTLTTPYFLRKIGLIECQQGNWAAAKEAYERIKREYPESSQARDIDKYIAIADCGLNATAASNR